MSFFKVQNNGVITVDTGDILTDFQEAYKSALGEDLSLSTDTPQGQLMAIDTKYLSYAQEQAVLAANSLSVLTSTGEGLDVAGGIWGYYRKGAQYTVVNVVLRGTPALEVPAGLIFSDGENDYVLLDNVTISENGTVSAQVQCKTAGKIICKANTLNEVVTYVEGLDSVNNPTDGITGWERESDETFRQRITANWLNVRGRSILGAIIDNVAAIPEVVSVVGRENYSDYPTVIDGVYMKKHSIYLDVLGGSGEDIARVLTRQKTLGAATNGNTTVSYYDEDVGFDYSYQIDRPEAKNLYIQIEYSTNPFTPIDVEKQIKNNIVAFIQENPLMIGQTISGNYLYQALSNFEYAKILSVNVSLNNLEYSDYVQTSIEQIAVLAEENISCVRVKNVV